MPDLLVIFLSGLSSLVSSVVVISAMNKEFMDKMEKTLEKDRKVNFNLRTQFEILNRAIFTLLEQSEKADENEEKK